MPKELKKKQTVFASKEAVKLLISLCLVPERSISFETMAS